MADIEYQNTEDTRHHTMWKLLWNTGVIYLCLIKQLGLQTSLFLTIQQVLTFNHWFNYV